MVSIFVRLILTAHSHWALAFAFVVLLMRNIEMGSEPFCSGIKLNVNSIVGINDTNFVVDPLILMRNVNELLHDRFLI